MVQGVFDDTNPSTVKRWAYDDTGKWDADRNTNEFVAAMPDWRRHGLLAFTLCLQGGSPYGYFGGKHPWNNAAFNEDGTLQPAYVARAEKILDRADELGMVVILSLYYFGQDERLKDEAAVRRGVDETVDWILSRGYRHVVIEINNECDNDRYDHEILRPERVHELIDAVKRRERDGRRLLVGTSFCGGRTPTPNVVRSSDFLLLHGNGQSAKGIKRLAKNTREVDGYRPMPIVNNEDDHYDFDDEENNFVGVGRELLLVGLLRLPQRRRSAGAGLPERAGRLANFEPPQEGVLREVGRDHGVEAVAAVGNALYGVPLSAAIRIAGRNATEGVPYR